MKILLTLLSRMKIILSCSNIIFDKEKVVVPILCQGFQIRGMEAQGKTVKFACVFGSHSWLPFQNYLLDIFLAIKTPNEFTILQFSFSMLFHSQEWLFTGLSQKQWSHLLGKLLFQARTSDIIMAIQSYREVPGIHYVMDFFVLFLEEIKAREIIFSAS